MAMKVYFASPFFNEQQIERERRLVSVLRSQSFEVYAPSESCVLNPNATEDERNQVFQDNVDHLKSADVVFAVTDGKDIGTIWESGFFYSLSAHNPNRYLVYYCETLGNNPFNVMLAKSADYVLTKQEDAERLANMIMTGEKQSYVGKIQQLRKIQ